MNIHLIKPEMLIGGCTTKSTVKYGRSVNSASEYQDLYMDIYEGKGDTGSLRPLVIFCFGGSFVSVTDKFSLALTNSAAFS